MPELLWRVVCSADESTTSRKFQTQNRLTILEPLLACPIFYSARTVGTREPVGN